MRAGTYAYRFSGYAMKKKREHHLVGIGTMQLHPDFSITGQHRAALLTFVSDLPVQRGLYDITGTYEQLDDDGRDFEAEITFTRKPWDDDDTIKQVIVGTFSLVPAGGADGFWLISTHTFNETEGEEAEEVVSGEAILIA